MFKLNISTTIISRYKNIPRIPDGNSSLPLDRLRDSLCPCGKSVHRQKSHKQAQKQEQSR